MTTTKTRRRTLPATLPASTTNAGNIDLKAVLIAALTVPGNMSRCYNLFHRYSFLNQVLVYLQTGHMEPLATYRRWAKLGRQVMRGQSALYVNHPAFAPETDENREPVIDPATGKTLMKVIGFYPKASVFQLSQTDGPDLVLPDLPDWNKEQALSVLGVEQVAFRDGDGNTQGYSIDKRFAINPVAAWPAKTMMHELAHIVLGHTTAEGVQKYQTHSHRGIAEFQAEATALLVCRELGVEFDESGSRAYIQHWLGDQGVADRLQWDTTQDDVALVTDAIVKQVFSATDKIIVAGRKRHYDKQAEEEGKG